VGTFGSARGHLAGLACGIGSEPSTEVIFMTIDETFDAEILVESSVDPVCETPVNPDEAFEHQLSSTFADREYLFCSTECKREFERKPTAYAVAGRSQP
jgi:YHS domain-containing protein